MHHHFDPAFKGTVYRNIGHEVLFLCAGQILLISHGEKNHLMPSCLQRLGQPEERGQRSLRHLVPSVLTTDKICHAGLTVPNRSGVIAKHL